MNLTWHDYIKFYANKACSTINTLRLLGNANRGFSPYHKRRLYISNVLPVMMYGAQLWWHPSWKRISYIGDQLQYAQTRAARWITGGFRTTPIGTLEMMAALLPLRVQINTYMSKAALRAHTVHAGHPIWANLPVGWLQHDNNLTLPFRMKQDGQGSKAEQACVTPFTHIRRVAKMADEIFDPLHDECQPGRRICDVYENRINFTDGPTKPKPGEKGDVANRFNEWLATDLLPLIKDAEEHPLIRTIWSDRSLMWDQAHKRRKSGAAWSVKHMGNELKSGKLPLGNATPYDCEVAALALGLRDAVQDCPENIKEIHIFAGNKSALNLLFSLKCKPAQRDKIWASTFARAFLSADQERRIFLHWVPGHVGIKQNEAIDKLAKEAVKMEQPKRTTFSVARENIESAALRKWHTMMRDDDYSGHQSLIKGDEFGRIKPKAKQHWWMREMGGCRSDKNTGGFSRLYARATRLISGHMPISKYRERFHLDGRSHCVCGKPDTRDHMLTDCPVWIRTWKPAAPVTPQEENLLQGMDPVDRRSCLQPFGHEEIRQFLLLNPMAGTFEWANLCDQRDADIANGDERSYAVRRVWVETYLKPRAYKTWDNWADHNARSTFCDLMSFVDLWGSSHEWTVRVRCSLGEEDPNEVLSADSVVSMLPHVNDKKNRKPVRYNHQAVDYSERFAMWLLNCLDDDLKWHPPGYDWNAEPHQNRRPSGYRRGPRVRSALDFDSDSEDEGGGNHSLPPTRPRRRAQLPSRSNNSTATSLSVESSQTPGVRVRQGDGVRDLDAGNPAPVPSQKRRAELARANGGSYPSNN